MKRLLPLAPLLLAAPLAAGCARTAADGPSLLPRAAEGGSFDEPAAAPAAPVAADPALDARIATLAAATTQAAAQFDAADRAAAPALAAGRRSRIGGDAWLEAQTALAGLEAQRAAVLDTLTALETLASDRTAAGEPAYPALDAARAAADTAYARVAATLARRQAALPAQ